MVAN
ncbi:hypothetical protein D049_1334A, partial [Vibrio parahaemolyticus VPTS-2010]|jgi:hypothetical protein